jgi:hypothetical protein
VDDWSGAARNGRKGLAVDLLERLLAGAHGMNSVVCESVNVFGPMAFVLLF